MKRFLPLTLLLLCIAWVGSTLKPSRNDSAYDLPGFSKLPVLVNGRVKPLDSVARNTLMVIQGRQRVQAPDGREVSPAEWMLETLFRPEQGDAFKVFEIVHPEVLALLQLEPEQGAGKKRFSLAQMGPRLAELERQARLAMQEDAGLRTVFQKAVLQLHSAVSLHQKLRFSIQVPDTKDPLADLTAFQARLAAGVAAVRAKEAGQAFDENARTEILADANKYSFLDENALLHPIPPAPGAPEDAWRTFGGAAKDAFTTGSIPAEALAYAGLGHAWIARQPAAFNEIVSLYGAQVAKAREAEQRKAGVEVLFNRAQPFYTSALLYVVVFLAAVFSWLFLPRELGRAAYWILLLAFVLSTAGILSRMWLEGRPPVTNLYSSALFVGWVGVVLSIVVESIYRNSLGAMAGGIVGACTLVIAHHLSTGGDTMEMMRAVLDSNFWLATHVVTISIGYGATIFAGIFAMIYIFFGVMTPRVDRELADNLTRIVYGIVCFATFFSFVGTILGGIWADQSWGRFWGWDPKENGALIIVLWCAIILHARWGGIVRQRGFMALAVGGNIVTGWSWFGTNMLGVGLHSYGFNDKGAMALGAWIVLNLAFIGLACLPTSRWRSQVQKS